MRNEAIWKGWSEGGKSFGTLALEFSLARSTIQKILKTLVQDGLIDSVEHAVGILNHSVFISVAEGKLELYDIAVYLCGYQTWPQTWTTEDKATATNNQYLAGAPKEWEDAAKHILGMKL